MSLPPLDLKTIRCAEFSDEMSTVSSPALPSIVMVLKFRLVNGALKLPMTWIVSPLFVPPSGVVRIVAVVGGGIEGIDGDLFDIVEFGNDGRR